MIKVKKNFKQAQLFYVVEILTNWQISVAVTIYVFLLYQQ